MLYVICYMLYTETNKGNQHIILPQIGWAQNKIKQTTACKGATVCSKPPTGRPLCLDPMIQHMILPQIGLGQEN